MNYVPVSEKDKQEMLAAIGVKNTAELFNVIPASKHLKKLDLPEGMSEQKLVRHMESLAAKNATSKDLVWFRGAGAYDHYIPSLIGEITGRTEFLTAYTPYQPEASQGTLQAIFEYQSMICELTGLDVSNASLYDGATAVAEAALLALRSTGRSTLAVSSAIHPEYMQVLRTYLEGSTAKIVEVPCEAGATLPEKTKQLLSADTAALIVQSPNFFGVIEDLQQLRAVTKDASCQLVTVVNPISLGALQTPGEVGADIAVGEGQILGSPAGMGGFSFGFMACQKSFSWKMPGRIVGQTTDTQGRRGFVLTLQSREQHIRREKATSNICTNAALNAMAACVYLSGWGPDGIRELAELNIQKSHYALNKLSKLNGFAPAFPAQPFFNEFVLRTTKDIKKIQAKLLENGILGPFELGRLYPKMADCLLFCVTEARTAEEIDLLVKVLS